MVLSSMGIDAASMAGAWVPYGFRELARQHDEVEAYYFLCASGLSSPTRDRSMGL